MWIINSTQPSLVLKPVPATQNKPQGRPPTLCPCYSQSQDGTGRGGTGRRGRGRRRKEGGVPAGICDRKRPCSEVTPLGGKSRTSSFQGPPESGKDRLTHFPLTRGMSQRGSSCRKPSPHCQSRTEALWEPGGQEVSEQPTPIPARPVPPLPLLTEHPPVATRSVLSRAATDDTQKGCSRPGSPCSP